MTTATIVNLFKISALSLASAIVASADSHAQPVAAATMERPALASAMSECEAGAREGVLTGRALGACDVILRDDSVSEAIRARVLVNRGVIALKRNEAGPAQGDLEQAVELAPDLAEAWLSLSAARIKVGDVTGAVQAAQRALDLEIRTPALAHFNIAIAEESAGRYDPAYEAYRRAAELAPDDPLLQAQPRRFLRHQVANPTATD